MQKKIKFAAAVVLACLLCGCGNTEREKSTAVFNEFSGEGPVESLTTDEETQTERETISDTFGRELAAGNMVRYQKQAEDLCALINAYRLENGLEKLETDETLTKIAMHRASENAYMNWLETTEDESGLHHLRPDGSGVADIFRSYGKFGTFGEILGRRQQNVEEVFADWKRSPAHDACMKNGEFERIGAGIARAENGDYYYAVVFLKEIQ